jgi:hypothetical protein
MLRLCLPVPAPPIILVKFVSFGEGTKAPGTVVLTRLPALNPVDIISKYKVADGLKIDEPVFIF